MQNQLEDCRCLLSGGTLISDVTWALEDIKSFSQTSERAHLDIYKKTIREHKTQNKNAIKHGSQSIVFISYLRINLQQQMGLPAQIGFQKTQPQIFLYLISFLFGLPNAHLLSASVSIVLK